MTRETGEDGSVRHTAPGNRPVTVAADRRAGVAASSPAMGDRDPVAVVRQLNRRPMRTRRDGMRRSAPCVRS